MDPLRSSSSSQKRPRSLAPGCNHERTAATNTRRSGSVAYFQGCADQAEAEAEHHATHHAGAEGWRARAGARRVYRRKRQPYRRHIVEPTGGDDRRSGTNRNIRPITKVDPMKPPRTALPLPRYTERKPLKGGGGGYFFHVRAKHRRAGCQVHDEPLGTDYDAAVKRVETILLPAIDAWRSGDNKSMSVPAVAAVGTLDRSEEHTSE